MRTDEMVCLDTNILVYADNLSSPHHARARAIVGDALGGRLKTCLTPQNLAEYYGIVTSRQRVPSPLTPAEASLRIHKLLATRKIRRVHPKRGTLGRCIRACASSGISGAVIYDRLLAATLLDHGIARILTHNVRDFAGITGFTAENPFA